MTVATHPTLPPIRPQTGAAWQRRIRRPWLRLQRPRCSPEAVLGAIPSFPRHVLSRLTTALIDRMDDLDGDPDREPEPDDEETHDHEAEDHHG